MSGHGSPEEIQAATNLWFRVSMLSIAFIVIPATTAVVYMEATHHHEHGKTYPHSHRMLKAFPWAAHECAMFDIQCKKDWKAAKAGGAVAAHH